MKFMYHSQSQYKYNIQHSTPLETYVDVANSPLNLDSALRFLFKNSIEIRTLDLSLPQSIHYLLQAH